MKPPHTRRPLTRRSFLKTSSVFGALTIIPSYVALGNQSTTGLAPSEKIRLAIIGIGNQGNRDRKSLLRSGLCDVVALCDIDMDGAHTHEARYVHRLTNKPPVMKDGEAIPEQSQIQARAYMDFRKMFDDMANDIDAVLIATPDHSHFAATMLAMSLGKHVFVEKPLAHTFAQCERLMDLAARSGVVTQMGNQGHSGPNYFQFKAWSEAGIIKDITRITAHMNIKRRWHGWGASASSYPSEPISDNIQWEQWHDVVATDRPFSNKLHPQQWRSWYEFGSGCFGDWAPHILDTCHRFLQLGLPERIVTLDRGGINPYDLVYPESSTIRFDFPARGPNLPACEVTWYDGLNNEPTLAASYTKDGKDELLKSPGKELYSEDLAFKGGHHGQALQIVPRAKFLDMRASLPRFPQKNSSHYANFLLACKGEESSRSPFSVSGPLTQVMTLGMLAQRFGGQIEFDRHNKRITNNPTANVLLDPAPRKEWECYYKL